MNDVKSIPTGAERRFSENEMIVSKTDKTGRILYANHVFLEVSGYDEEELLGAPQSIVRHPDMPRCIFKLLWDNLHAGKEIFAYIDNLAKDGAHYWVLAHVTPSFDSKGTVIGYHSSRRSPPREAIAAIEPLYRELLSIERSVPNAREGMLKAEARLSAILAEKGMDYPEFIFSIINASRA